MSKRNPSGIAKRRSYRKGCKFGALKSPTKVKGGRKRYCKLKVKKARRK